MVYQHKWSPVSCRSSTGQGKFTDQRPTIYIPEMTFVSHSRSSAISSLVRSPGLSNGDKKSRLHFFSDKDRLNDLEGKSRLLAMAQFNRPHILSIIGL